MKREEDVEAKPFSHKTKIFDNLKKISELGIKGPFNLKKQTLSSNQIPFPSKRDLPNQTQTFFQSIDFPKSTLDEKFRKTNLSTKILKNLCKTEFF